MKNLVIINTKGGVGKTNISLNVLPLLYANKGKIRYYHLDDNNEFDIKSKFLDIKQFKKDGFAEAIAEVEFEEHDMNIIDSGGGSDTEQVLNEIAESTLENLIFIIPTNKNLSTRKNIEDTIKMITNKFKNPSIYLFFNYMTGDKKDVKEHYKNIYGNEVFNIKPLDISAIRGVGYVLESEIFEILEFRKTTLRDKYEELKSIAHNHKDFLKEQKTNIYNEVNEGKINKEEAFDLFKKVKDNVTQAKILVDLSEKIIKMNTEFRKLLLR